MPQRETFSAKSKDNLGFIVGAPTSLEIEYVRLEGYGMHSEGCSSLEPISRIYQSFSSVFL